MVVRQPWNPNPFRFASSLSRSSEKRYWLCSYAILPEPGPTLTMLDTVQNLAKMGTLQPSRSSPKRLL